MYIMKLTFVSLTIEQKNLIMVTYLDWFAMYLLDKSFQEELLNKARRWRTNKKAFIVATRIMFLEKKRKGICTKFVTISETESVVTILSFWFRLLYNGIQVRFKFNRFLVFGIVNENLVIMKK